METQQPTQPVLNTHDEDFGWQFHKWPFLVALAVTLVLYLAVWAFVDPEPPYINPADLPLPPGSF